MAEVLSQSQIDALLNAVRTGEKDLEESSGANPDKKYPKYNFRDPRKFTKDRIKMLNSIFENYTRIINSRLNSILHTNCEITVETIEEQRYYEFSNALTDGDVLALANAELKGKVEDEYVMLYLSTGLALNMIDRMLGGDGAASGDPPSGYTYTDLELRLYENIVKDIFAVMGSSWENYIQIDFSYVRTEINPTLVQLIGLDEIVVIVDLKLQLPEGEGRMSICLPGVMLTNIFTELNKESAPTRRVVGENRADDIFEELRGSDLEIVAALDEARLSLNDIYHLNVGDVIDLGYTKDSPVYLDIGGYHWFTGKMGASKKNMAVRIDEVCYQAKQRSE